MVVDVVEVETGISRNIFTSVVHLYDWSACDNTKHCQRHNGPRILSPKLELSLKAETSANSNLAL